MAAGALKTVDMAGGALGAGRAADNALDVVTPITSGVARSPLRSTPNSIYEQIGSDGTVVSRAFYDDAGRQFARQDFGKPHFDRQAQQYLSPHEHNYSFNDVGYPTGSQVVPLSPGYSNQVTR
jgi:hypothetical protein